MIQAAHVAPAPSGCHAVCFLLRLRSVRWSATPPGAAWAVQWPARSGAPPARAAASRGPSAALPFRESRPPYRDRRGPRCARQAPVRTSTAAGTAPVAGALGRGGGSARPLLRSRCVGLRLRSRCSLRPGPRRPGARVTSLRNEPKGSGR